MAANAAAAALLRRAHRLPWAGSLTGPVWPGAATAPAVQLQVPVKLCFEGEANYTVEVLTANDTLDRSFAVTAGTPNVQTFASREKFRLKLLGSTGLVIAYATVRYAGGPAGLGDVKGKVLARAQLVG